MWRRCENSSVVQPEEFDTTSSKKWNYIRRNFEFIEEQEIEEGQIIGAHWTWEENKVSKEDWETCEQVVEHNIALDDVYAALTELADIIAEV